MKSDADAIRAALKELLRWRKERLYERADPHVHEAIEILFNAVGEESGVIEKEVESEVSP